MTAAILSAMAEAPPEGPGEAFALGDAAFADCVVVRDFYRVRLRDRAEAAVKSQDQVAYFGQLLRAMAWLGTLAKLNEPSDFQAVTVAARSLFEGAVDATLLHFGPSDGLARMDAWELSVKLRQADKMARYVVASGREPTDAEQKMVDFATKEKPRIEALRLKFWPDPKKPGKVLKHERWTGRNLLEDAKEADKLRPSQFEDFYTVRFAEICWNTHGSGAAGITGIAPTVFPFIGARAAREAANFAVIIAELTSQHLDCWSADTFTALEQRRRGARAYAYAAKMGIAEPE